MLFTTQQLELANRATFWSHKRQNCAYLSGLLSFFQNGSGDNFNKNGDNNTVYRLMQHEILHGKNEPEYQFSLVQLYSQVHYWRIQQLQ